MSSASYANILWGGQIIRNQIGIDYTGGYSMNLEFGSITQYNDFLQAIRNAIQLEGNSYISSVLFRRPLIFHDGIYYDIMHISNDLQFFYVLEYCRNFSVMVEYQFYVEINIVETTMEIENSFPVFDQQDDDAGGDGDDDDDDDDDDYSGPTNHEEEDEDSEDDEEAEMWFESEDSDDENHADDDDIDDHDRVYENPIIPLVHPPPYSEIDYSLMEINTYAKPGEKTHFDPAKEFIVGMLFASRDHVAAAAAEYSMRRHVQFRSKLTNPRLYEIKCAKPSNGCCWRLRAILMKKTQQWTISKYNGPHTCTNIQISTDHRQLNQKFISHFIEPMVEAQPNIKVKTLQAELKDKLGFLPTYRKTWKAKQMAIERIFGGCDD